MSIVAISHLLGLTFVARAWCEMLGSPLSTPSVSFITSCHLRMMDLSSSHTTVHRFHKLNRGNHQ